LIWTSFGGSATFDINEVKRSQVRPDDQKSGGPIRQLPVQFYL